MSGYVMGLALECSKAVGSTRLVLIVIADAADQHGTNAWPSIKTIAQRAAVSERTAQRCLQDLVEMGELKIEINGAPRGRPGYRPNYYAIAKMDDWVAEAGVRAANRNLMRGVTAVTPLKLAGVTTSAGRGVTGGNSGVTHVTPDPSYDPSYDPSIDHRFEEFYKLYPRKTNKAGALKAWKKIKPSGDLVAKIMARLKTFIAVDWSQTEVQYIPHPATWLNGARWEDAVVQPISSTWRINTPDFVPPPEIPRRRELTPEERLANEKREHARWLAEHPEMAH